MSEMDTLHSSSTKIDSGISEKLEERSMYSASSRVSKVESDCRNAYARNPVVQHATIGRLPKPPMEKINLMTALLIAH